MKTLLLSIAVVIALFVVGAYGISWRSIATIDAVEVSSDQASKPCYWSEKYQQLICYNVFKTWAGAEDASPAYVFDHGKYVPLFER